MKIGTVFEITKQDKDAWRKEAKVTNRLNPDYVEIWLEHPKGITGFLREDVSLIDDLTSSYPSLVHAPIDSMSFVTPHERIREVSIQSMRDTIDICAQLNVKRITFHGGEVSLLKQRNIDVLSIFKESLSHFMDYAEQRGQVLCLENLPFKKGIRTNYPSRIKELEKCLGLDERLKATLDVGHCIRNKEDPIEVFQKLGNKIGNVHLHDVKGGDDHLPLGKGDFDVGSFVDVIKDDQEYVTLEVFDPGEKKKVEESLDFLRTLL